MSSCKEERATRTLLLFASSPFLGVVTSSSLDSPCCSTFREEAFVALSFCFRIFVFTPALAVSSAARFNLNEALVIAIDLNSSRKDKISLLSKLTLISAYLLLFSATVACM